MADKRSHFSLKWLGVLVLSILCSTSALAEEKASSPLPKFDATVQTHEISGIPPFLNGPKISGIPPFLSDAEDGGAWLPISPLKLLERVRRPCVKVETDSITLSFSNADVEKFVRLHTKAKDSPSRQQEMVEAVWAVIPPASDNRQCAEIPRTIPDYAYRHGRSGVDLSLFIRNVLDHLLTQEKAVIHTHTGELVTTVYVRTKRADCPMCGRIPPWLMSYSLEPDSPPVWQGLAPEEYE